MGVSTKDSGAAWARGASRFVVRWPEADCAAEARLDFRSDADAYHVVVDVVAEELGKATASSGSAAVSAASSGRSLAACSNSPAA